MEATSVVLVSYISIIQALLLDDDWPTDSGEPWTSRPASCYGGLGSKVANLVLAHLPPDKSGWGPRNEKPWRPMEERRDGVGV